jgi:plastocyanin
MRGFGIAAAAVVAAWTLACSDATGGGGGCTPSATQVCMVGSQFSPTNLTVSAGTRVTWKNGDSFPHTVASATGSPESYNSGSVGAGGTFSQTFGSPGTYPYYCTIHGTNGSPPTGMHGTITVN